MHTIFFMKKFYLFFLPAIVIAAISFFVLNDNFKKEGFEEDEEYDGPEKAAELAYRKMINPTTGRVNRQDLWEAILQTTQLKEQRLNSPSGVSALSWVERGSYTDATGPSNVNQRPGNGVTSGRMRAVWADLADPTGKTVWVGGVDGGLWKTTDVTASTPVWTVVNDFLSNLSVSGICQDPVNTNTMYFCTGESFFNADAVFGNGVFKSTDHGVTWTQLASTTTLNRCSKILCDAAGNVYVSTIGISVAVGLQRSSDGGTTWTSINPFSTTSRIVDFEISSTGTMHVSAGLASAAGIGGYRYTNNPAAATATTGWNSAVSLFTFPTGASSRTELACSGNTVYAALATTNTNASSSLITAIAKSVDGGANWTTTALTPGNIQDLNGSTTTGGQGWYSIGLAADPANPDNVIVGSLNNLRSTNGGTTFSKISEWVGVTGQYVHADVHNITWYDNGNKCLIGCDGGLFYTANGGTTFSDKNTGLRLKQFYSVAIHPTQTNYFLAGAQDNGTHQFNGAGLTSSVEVTGGDGAYVDIDQDEPQYQFGAYVFNQYRRSTNGGASWSSVNFSGTAGEFINPFDYDDAANVVYCCYNANQYLRWDNPQTGNTFTPITMTNFNGGKAEAITVSPFTANRVFFGTSSARVVRVDNANTATPTEANITPAAMTGFVNAIVLGSTEQNIMACVASTGTTNVWVSADGGTNWTACDGNLPDIPVYSAVFHPDNNSKAFIATEAGVWYTDALNGASTVWLPETSFPTVKTEMLRYRSSDRTIAAATHGRGLWTAVVPSGCTAAGITSQPVNSAICVSANTSFSVTATAVSYQWQESTNVGGTWNNITNGGIYSGAATTTLTLTGVTAGMNTYQYRCVVLGDCNAVPVNSGAGILTVNAGATITTQPAASTICSGNNTSFTVAATGPSLSYQWQVSTDGGVTFNNVNNGGIYSGVNTPTLNITGALAAMNNNRYRCAVTSSCGTLNSAAVILTVNTTPTISSQPVSTAVCAGNAVTFSVTAAATGISYQWQESTNGGATWNNIAGATAASYNFTATLAQNSYQYRCIISGTCNPSVTSTAATLTVGSTLVINNQPANTIVCAGATATYAVNVSGTVTYQWQESTNGGTTYNSLTNGGIYSGVTTATLTLTGVTSGANNNLYRCIISGNCPSINSNGALLTVNTAPAITTQPPANITVCAAQNALLNVAAGGTGITYQWQVSTNGGATFTSLTNTAPYSGVTTTSLSITGAAAGLNGNVYHCVVSGACTPAATTVNTSLTVNTPATVSANPVNSIVCENSNASFSVTAAGSSPSYQWQVSSNGGATFINVANGGVYSGATSSILTLAGVSSGLHNNQYRCIVTGAASCGTANSTAGVLNINNAPAAFAITGGGSYCAGGAGVPVGLNNSTTGINYQLQFNGTNTGTALAGTGAALNFGNKTAAGTYTAIATNNTTGCTAQMPGSVTVSIFPQPTVTLNAAPYLSVFPGLTTTVTANAVSGTAPYSYTWFRNNTIISNSGNTYNVAVTNMGDFKVFVTDANGCTAQSQVISIADSANNKLFIYPSPNDGRFNVVYYNQRNTSVERTLSIFSSKGEKVYYNKFTVSQAYQVIAIDLRRHGADVYYVVLGDGSGAKLKTGEVLVQ